MQAGRGGARSGGRARGFTLFELTLVVLILAIAAAVVVPMASGDLRSARLKVAANTLASDIEFCQGDCINQPSTPRQISFDLTNNTYTVQDRTTGAAIAHPADGQPFVNDFSTGRNAPMAGVTLGNITMGTGSLNVLTFDTYGRPLITADWTVTLVYNGNAMAVTVRAGTGDVTITNVAK